MKNKIIAALLAFFLGEWGFHKFYLNDKEAGKNYLIWCLVGIFLSPIVIGIIPLLVLLVKKLVDCFTYLFMSDEEFDEKFNNAGHEKGVLTD